MAKKFIVCLIALLLVFPALFAVAAPAESNAPTVTALRGHALIFKAGGYGHVSIYNGMEIGSGDVIRTDLNSSVTVSFFNKEIVVGELTQVSLNAIWNRHDRDVTSVVLTEGMVKNRVDTDLNKNSRNEIRTSNTVAGVRGTEYILVYSRMGLVDGGEENPYTRLKVIDGDVRVDITDENAEESFLVDFGGAKKVTENISGEQTEEILPIKPDNLDVPFEDLDSEILQNLKNDPRAEGIRGSVDAALEAKGNENSTIEQRPQPVIITGSEAPTVIPTLPLPTDEEDGVIPPSSSKVPVSSSSTSSAVSSSSSNSQTSSSSSNSHASSSSSSSSSHENSGNSGGGSGNGSGGGSGGLGSSSSSTPPPVPESDTLYIEDISGEPVAAILNKFGAVTSTLTLTSRGATSLSLNRSLTIPAGKILVIDSIGLGMPSNILRCEGKLINRGTINCDTFVNRSSGSLNDISGIVNSGTVTVSGGSVLTNKGLINTTVCRNDYAELRNEGTLNMQAGVNTGALYNSGNITSDEAIATITNGAYMSVIYQISGSITVDDEYVITGMGVSGNYFDCGKIAYTGGNVKSNSKQIVDCIEASHGHLNGLT